MTAPASAPTAARLRSRLAPRGLTWSVLRLHRTALYVGGAALVAFAAAMVWMYVIGDDARVSTGPCSPPGYCPNLTSSTFDDTTYRRLVSLTAEALSYLMFPVGAWAGGALIGRELESGTARLAWTQSVTPLRWLAAKLAVPALLLTAGTTTAVLLNVWARQDGGPDLALDWYSTDTFITTGPAAVTYALAGLALGALAGMVTRRALPAAGLGFAATLAFFNLMDWYRWNLWPTSSVTVSGPDEYQLPQTALHMSSGYVLTSGERSESYPCRDMPGPGCVKEGDITGYYTVFHPQSHHWPLQLMDAGIALALAALATAGAFWLLRRSTPSRG
ncbi:hypothetical protein G6048_44555 [Streptomyces sp. YC419]|uniref:ABC transporter permease n=2 Tax=Streptomyces ureilyticus TaxID=1775131 RepID=A0ABX0E761_9ACTN|nr:hypothetical protein [Streptomyces ureilyticus]